MRVSKVFVVILGVGIFIIGAVALYLIYNDTVSEQETLEVSISTAQATLPNIASQRTSLQAELEDLNEQLGSAGTLLEEAASQFPEEVLTYDYGEKLFALARQFEMRMVEFSATEPFSYLDGGVSYTAITCKVSLETEDRDDIMAYLNTIENDPDFESARIDFVIQDIPEPSSDVEEGQITQADITITILSYGGAQ